jgi:hypothetical protein
LIKDWDYLLSLQLSVLNVEVRSLLEKEKNYSHEKKNTIVVEIVLIQNLIVIIQKIKLEKKSKIL